MKEYTDISNRRCMVGIGQSKANVTGYSHTRTGKKANVAITLFSGVHTNSEEKLAFASNVLQQLETELSSEKDA